MHNSCLTNNVALLLKCSLKCINFTTLYDLMVCESRTSHQRETKPWPPRHYKPQRIRQEWGDRTPIWHQPPVFLFSPPPSFLFWGALFNTSAQNGPHSICCQLLHRPTPPACESTWKEKHRAVPPDAWFIHILTCMQESWNTSSELSSSLPRSTLIQTVLSSELPENIEHILHAGFGT